MPQYKAPLRDINFVLKNVLNANEHFASLAGREEVSEDLLDAILSEGAKFSENVLSPLNQVGDQEGGDEAESPGGCVFCPEEHLCSRDVGPARG